MENGEGQNACWWDGQERQEKTGRAVSWGGPGGKEYGTRKERCLERGIVLQRSLADPVFLS